MFTKDSLKRKYSMEGYLPNYPPHLISDEELYNAFLPLDLFVFDERSDRYDCSLPHDNWQKFIDDDHVFVFKDNYPLLGENVIQDYKNIITEIAYHLNVDLLFDVVCRNDGPRYFKGITEASEYYGISYTDIKKSIDEGVYAEGKKFENVKVPNWVYSYMLGSVISVNSNKEDIHDLLVALNVDNIDDEFVEESGLACKAISKMWLSSASQSQRWHRPVTIFGELHVVKYLRLKGMTR